LPGSEHSPLNADALQALLKPVLAAAREAGTLAAARFRTRVHRQRKADGSPVTEVDLAVDALLREQLMQLLPQAGWLSEESTQGDGWLAHRQVWCIDPLDGTGGFLRRDPHWCISVALLQDGAPVLGVVHAPVLQRTWWAAHGGGALMNGMTARVSHRQALEGARIIGRRNLLDAAAWERPWPRVELRRYPSLALRLSYVASGEADGMLSTTAVNYWDVAAGDIIVREAGGIITDAEGVPLRYEDASARVHGVIAAAPALHEEMRTLAQGWRGCARHGNTGKPEKQGNGT